MAKTHNRRASRKPATARTRDAQAHERSSMPKTLDEVLVQLSLGIQDLSTTVAELQSRLGNNILPAAERQTIMLALPTLKTDLRDAEARFAALAANAVSFQPPSDAAFDTLKTAADHLSATTARRQATSAIVQAATALIASIRGVAPAPA